MPELPRSQGTTHCLFCDVNLHAATKPEHILLNALGGRKTSRRLICSACNQKFGETIDAVVAAQVAELRNHLLLPAGDGKPPPTLSNIKAGEDTLTMRGDGTLDLVQKPFEVDQAGDRTNIRMQLRSTDDVALYLPHIAASLGLSVEQLVASFQSGSGSKVSRPADTIHFKLHFGGPEFLRSAVKSALELWATVVGNEEIRGPAYSAARTFVVQGGDAFNRGRTQIDSRLVPGVEILKSAFGPVFNLIYIRSDEAGRVIGHFTLYNILGWQFVLAEKDGTPLRTAALVVNALDPRIWSDKPSDVPDIPISWLEAPHYAGDFHEQTKRVSAALEVAHDRGMHHAIGRIVEQEFAATVSAEPVELSEDQWRDIVGRISHRAAHLFLRLEYEEQLSSDEIERLISDGAAKAASS